MFNRGFSLGGILAGFISGSMALDDFPQPDFPIFNVTGDTGGHHQSRRGGQRAHRNWKRTRAAGITKRVRR